MRILIVDDMPESLEFLGEVLSGRHEVVMSDSGEAAIEHFDQKPFDLVMTDYDMPGMTGLDVLWAVRERSVDTPVVLITGGVAFDNAYGGSNPGFEMVLHKPIELRKLMTLVKQLEDARSESPCEKK